MPVERGNLKTLASFFYIVTYYIGLLFGCFSNQQIVELLEKIRCTLTNKISPGIVNVSIYWQWGLSSNNNMRMSPHSDNYFASRILL